jgi:hypothetical protein
MIVGNVISGNAADTDDAATPGTTGINIYSVAPVTGTIIALNKISNEQVDIAVNTPAADVQVNLNDLQGQTGVDNLGSGTVDAMQNYWGCAAGPGQSSCGAAVGLALTGAYAIVPF